MDRKEIEAKVIDIICDQLQADRDSVTLETSFVDDLNADSLDIAELTMEFEDEFDIDVPEDGEPPVTVGDIVNFIEKELA